MQEYLTSLGRKTYVINLDPANDRLCYECHLNIFDLISVEDVMVNCKLGPNGGLIYCMEFLEKNIDWLIEGLKNLCQKKDDDIKNAYLLFDLPGQVELYVITILNLIQ
jgi:hypothetical protein